MKPMNCPFHILIYRDSLKSYRDLPVRLGELGTVYRYERSGVMHGLLRVRGFTQDDAHIFCTPEQIEDEVVGCIDFALATLHTYRLRAVSGGAFDLGPERSQDLRRPRRSVGAGARSLEQALKRRNIRVQNHSRRSGVLRAEDRHQAGGRHRPAVAAFDRAVRLHPARALRPGVRRRGRQAPSAADGASRALWLGGALLRRADRALRRSVSGVAVAGAGGRYPHRREAPRVRE
jgi:hypothetical protein